MIYICLFDAFLSSSLHVLLQRNKYREAQKTEATTVHYSKRPNQFAWFFNQSINQSINQFIRSQKHKSQ